MEDEGPRATLKELKNIMRFWLNMGADGFRVDMAGSLLKHDYLQSPKYFLHPLMKNKACHTGINHCNETGRNAE
mgnify:CR=1 FL=1